MDRFTSGSSPSTSRIARRRWSPEALGGCRTAPTHSPSSPLARPRSTVTVSRPPRSISASTSTLRAHAIRPCRLHLREFLQRRHGEEVREVDARDDLVGRGAGSARGAVARAGRIAAAGPQDDGKRRGPAPEALWCASSGGAEAGGRRSGHGREGGRKRDYDSGARSGIGAPRNAHASRRPARRLWRQRPAAWRRATASRASGGLPGPSERRKRGRFSESSQYTYTLSPSRSRYHLTKLNCDHRVGLSPHRPLPPK